jgi:hypothetical protein
MCVPRDGRAAEPSCLSVRRNSRGWVLVYENGQTDSRATGRLGQEAEETIADDWATTLSGFVSSGRGCSQQHKTDVKGWSEGGRWQRCSRVD